MAFSFQGIAVVRYSSVEAVRIFQVALPPLPSPIWLTLNNELFHVKQWDAPI